MPSTRITTGAWAESNAGSLIEAIQGALEESLKIPDWDRDIVLYIVPAGRRIVPSGRSDRYTRIEIAMFAGRSLEAKRALYRCIVRNLERLGVPTTEIKIILVEVPPENWGIRGGVPASEVDLGFKVDV